MTEEEAEATMLYLQLLLDRGCKILFKTILFGKSYVWMKDKTDSIFLERIPEQYA